MIPDWKKTVREGVTSMRDEICIQSWMLDNNTGLMLHFLYLAIDL